MTADTDSVVAAVSATDNLSLKRLQIVVDGDSLLDTLFTSATPSYDKSFSISSNSSSIIVEAVDGAGNMSVDTASVGGSGNGKLQLVSPVPNSEGAPGQPIFVQLRAKTNVGFQRVGYVVSGAFQKDTTYYQLLRGTADTLLNDQVTVPGNVAIGQTFTITAVGIDTLARRTTGPSVVVTVQSATSMRSPLVHQIVPPRVEARDSVTIQPISASGIRRAGLSVRCERTPSASYPRDSVLPSTFLPGQPVVMRLEVPTACVGGRIFVMSYAESKLGPVGYSVPTSATLAQADSTQATRDTAVAVGGQTYAVSPDALSYQLADIAVDAAQRRAFVSDIGNDRIQVWESAAQRFTKQIPVGSQPWGLFISGSSLYVANSGGTNISHVSIAGATSSLQESQRYRTQNVLAYDFTWSMDQKTQGPRYDNLTVIDYSDRPQYLAAGASGALYFSTKPTPSATDGTLRKFDPTLTPQPEPTQFGDYMDLQKDHWVVLNADAVGVIRTPTDNPSDSVTICDHAYGHVTSDYRCVTGTDPAQVKTALDNALTTAYGQPSNVLLYVDRDVESLGLSDTTFVAAGGDGQWIGFGEGHTAGTGRVMMVKDGTTIFSSGIAVTDLIDNASEPVFGLAINSNSSGAVARGAETYFFDVEDPFHLRLWGKRATYPTGAGVTYHPNNRGDLSRDMPDERIAFVASGNNTIDIVDTYYFGRGRGTIPVRANFYGPLRASLPFVGDDVTSSNPIRVKLFGLTSEGLVVINVHKCDILNDDGSSPCP